MAVKRQLADFRGNGPTGFLQQTINKLSSRWGAFGNPIDIAIASIALMMVDVDERTVFANRRHRIPNTITGGSIDCNDTIELFSGNGMLHQFTRIQKGQFRGNIVIIPADHTLAFVFSGPW